MGLFERYRKPSDLPSQIPVFPLSGALLLPRADLPLNIFEPRYLAMVDAAMAADRIIGMIQPLGIDEDGDRPDLMRIGCAGRISSYAETPDDRVLISLTGISRFEIVEEVDVDTPYRQVLADYRPFEVDFVTDGGANEVNRPALLKAFRDYLDANNMSADWQEVDEASTEVLVNTLSLLAPYPPLDKQALLEAPDLKTRADVLVALTEVALRRMVPGSGTRLQ